MPSVKDLTTTFAKLEKFDGVDFRRWQKKMHFLLTTLKVVYVFSTTRPVEPRRNDPWKGRGQGSSGTMTIIFVMVTF